jgi:hypothetical protein
MNDGLGLEDWTAGVPCVHDQAWHADCKPATDGAPQWVYMTEGFSAAYHYRRDCKSLESGQRQVERRGGTPAPIIRARIAKAKAAIHYPCRTCCKP